VRICDTALCQAAFHHRTHAADLKQILLLRTIASRVGVDLAPLCIAADTKIIRQREVHHFAPGAVTEPSYLT
jgi:hypothetical protein